MFLCGHDARLAGWRRSPWLEALEDRLALTALPLEAPVLSGLSPTAVVAADLNDDGRLDLVTTNYQTNDLTVLLGQGNGLFTTAPPVRLATAGFGPFFWPSSLAVGDLDRDGVLDIVTANSGNNTLSVLHGNGDGTFRVGAPRSLGETSPWAISLADVDADRRLDIVVVNGNNNAPSLVSILWQDEEGFTATSTFGVGIDARAVVVADLTGDGLLDVATANRGSHDLSVLEGRGNRDFASERRIDLGQDDHAPISVTAGDVDGDGFLDLVTANYGSATVSVILGKADSPLYLPRSFQVRSIDTHPVGQRPISVLLTDIDRDGRLDVVAANRDTDDLSVLLGAGNRVSTEAITVRVRLGSTPLPQPRESPHAVIAADLDGDGRIDLVTANWESSTVSILLGNGNATFRSPTRPVDGPRPPEPEILPPPLTDTHRALATGDFDRDGINDVAVAIAETNSVSILRGTGRGTFVLVQQLSVGRLPQAIAVTDLDGDGKLDLVTANLGSDDVSVFLGTGRGTFRAWTTHTLAPSGSRRGSGPISIAVADVDGDGRPDVVTANYYSEDVSVLLGTGTGSFAGELRYSVARADRRTGPVSIQIADLDDDDEIDLVTANFASDDVSILYGLGEGRFASPQRFSVAVPGTSKQSPVSVAIGDVDGDQRPDIVTANYTGGVVSVLLGSASQGFGSLQVHAVGTGPRSVALADVDRDGRLDLVTANHGSNSVSVLVGRVGGVFEERATLPVVAPHAVLVAQIDLDGKLDIVVANPFHEKQVKVFLGEGNGLFREVANVPPQEEEEAPRAPNVPDTGVAVEALPIGPFLVAPALRDRQSGLELLFSRTTSGDTLDYGMARGKQIVLRGGGESENEVGGSDEHSLTTEETSATVMEFLLEVPESLRQLVASRAVAALDLRIVDPVRVPGHSLAILEALLEPFEPMVSLIQVQAPGQEGDSETALLHARASWRGLTDPGSRAARLVSVLLAGNVLLRPLHAPDGESRRAARGRLVSR